MNRDCPMVALVCGRVPHARGDEPAMQQASIAYRMSVPHARGDEPACFSDMKTSPRLCMNPHYRVPHARGDEPHKMMSTSPARMNSRWFLRKVFPHARGDEPALNTGGVGTISGVPHARGDEPYDTFGGDMKTLFYCVPHARGDEP